VGINVETGAIFRNSDNSDPDDEVPDDLEIPGRYISIPHKNELELGRNLALSFVGKEIPGDYNDVANFLGLLTKSRVFS